MSLIFFDGFETVGTETGIANEATVEPRISLRYDKTENGGTPATTGFYLMDDQFGEGFAWRQGKNRGNYIRKNTVTESGKTYVVGCWVHVQDTTDTFINVIQPLRDLAGAGDNHITIRIDNLTDIVVIGPSGSVLARSDDVINAGTWHYIECKFKIDNTTGLVEVHVDGVQQINETNVDTQDFDTGVDAIQFGGVDLSGGTLTDTGEDYVAFDDIYMLKTESGAPDDFLGPRTRIKSLPPNGDNVAQWDTTSSGTVHYTLLDENGADSADYVETTTDTDRDEFDLTNMVESSGTFHAIKIEAEATDQGDTNNTLDVEVESGGSRSQTGFTVSSASAVIYVHNAATDPQGGGAWTKTRIDAMRAGIEFNT